MHPAFSTLMEPVYSEIENDRVAKFPRRYLESGDSDMVMDARQMVKRGLLAFWAIGELPSYRFDFDKKENAGDRLLATFAYLAGSDGSEPMDTSQAADLAILRGGVGEFVRMIYGNTDDINACLNRFDHLAVTRCINAMRDSVDNDKSAFFQEVLDFIHGKLDVCGAFGIKFEPTYQSKLRLDTGIQKWAAVELIGKPSMSVKQLSSINTMLIGIERDFKRWLSIELDARKVQSGTPNK